MRVLSLLSQAGIGLDGVDPPDAEAEPLPGSGDSTDPEALLRRLADLNEDMRLPLHRVLRALERLNALPLDGAPAEWTRAALESAVALAGVSQRLGDLVRLAEVSSFMSQDAPDDLPVIEGAVLRRLAADTEPRLLPSLTERFAHDVRTAIASLDRAVRNGDHASLCRTVHGLAGCAPTFGAMRLHAVSSVIESRFLTGSAKGVDPGMVGALIQEAEAVLGALAPMVESILASAGVGAKRSAAAG